MADSVTRERSENAALAPSSPLNVIRAFPKKTDA